MNFILEELLIHMQVSIYMFLYYSSNDHQKGEIYENLTIFLYRIGKIHPAVTLINICQPLTTRPPPAHPCNVVFNLKSPLGDTKPNNF